MKVNSNSFHLFTFLGALFIKNVCSFGGPFGHYSNEWIVKFSDNHEDVHFFARSNGFDLVSMTNTGYYLMRNNDVPMVSENSAAKTFRSVDTNKLVKFEQLRYLNRTARTVIPRNINVSDSQWSSMWHVHEEQFPSMNVYDAWVSGYTGDGILISIVDNGIEPTHPDLMANYDPTYSFDYLYNTSYVNHTERFESHGTLCAGVAAAVKNDDCVLGMAYNANMSAVKIFDNYYGLTDYGESMALVHGLEHVDIYSNSWGPFDDGTRFEGPGELAQAAFVKAVTEGRDGRGSIYTWAAGNGGNDDDCNADGYASSIYTISITSIGQDQGPSWYSEQCTSTLAGTYSGDSPDPRIATTTVGGGCTVFFQGTSASCPMGAGIIALALEANPTLSWRDVQHLIVETSVREGLVVGEWTTNGAGFLVSHVYGFGLMNAAGMVEAALEWTNVGEQVTCEREMAAINRVSDNGVSIKSEHVSDGCGGAVQFVEHVEVWMRFSATYRGSIMIKLRSPAGTQSRLLAPRQYDYFNETTEWTFMTVHSWGERPAGAWHLEVETVDSSTVFGLESWKLILYGTANPPANNPAAQVSIEETEDSVNVGAIVGGVVGGVVLFAVVAAVLYKFVLKKPKDPTVYPTSSTMAAETGNQGNVSGYQATSSGNHGAGSGGQGAENAGFQQE